MCTYGALVYVDVHPPFLPDGAEHRCPHQQVRESVRIEVNGAHAGAKIGAQLGNRGHSVLSRLTRKKEGPPPKEKRTLQ